MSIFRNGCITKLNGPSHYEDWIPTDKKRIHGLAMAIQVSFLTKLSMKKRPKSCVKSFKKLKMAATWKIEERPVNISNR